MFFSVFRGLSHVGDLVDNLAHLLVEVTNQVLIVCTWLHAWLWGATVLAIPCNTAHYFYDRLAEALPVPVLNMPRLTVADAKAAGCTKLGILATDGTLAAETYQLACQAQGIDWAVPSEEHQQEVMSVIYDDIKQGKRADMAKFGAAVHDLKKQGCDMAVLGCTELSLVKRDEHLGKFFIDSTEVLCRHALEACGVKPIGF